MDHNSSEGIVLYLFEFYRHFKFQVKKLKSFLARRIDWSLFTTEEI